jgi:hypothetical protein
MVTLTLAHSDDDLAGFLDNLADCLDELGRSD